jgi:hypothetical protein
MTKTKAKVYVIHGDTYIKKWEHKQPWYWLNLWTRWSAMYKRSQAQLAKEETVHTKAKVVQSWHALCP